MRPSTFLGSKFYVLPDTTWSFRTLLVNAKENDGTSCLCVRALTVLFPCRWSSASSTLCSCHRKVRYLPVDMDKVEDLVMEMNRLTW